MSIKKSVEKVWRLFQVRPHVEINTTGWLGAR